jgi:hypothetical protein
MRSGGRELAERHQRELEAVPRRIVETDEPKPAAVAERLRLWLDG